MKNETKLKIIVLFVLTITLLSSILLFSNTIVAEEYENQYGKLTVYPDVSTEIIRQKQFYNLTWYYPTNNLDIAFKFNNSLSYGSVYLWNGQKYVKLNVEHIEYDNKHWYLLENIQLNQYETKRGYWEYDVPLNSTGKWDLYAKLHSDTIQQALQSGRYIHIDPWWNSSYSYNVVGSITNPCTDYALLINLTYDSDMNSNFTDVRFVNDDNTTELYHWFEYVKDDTYAYVWVNISDSSIINMYYGNSDVSSFSSYNNPYHTFKDFINYNNISRFWHNTVGGNNFQITSWNGYIHFVESCTTTAESYRINLTNYNIDYELIVKWNTIDKDLCSYDQNFIGIRTSGASECISFILGVNRDDVLAYFSGGNGYVVQNILEDTWYILKAQADLTNDYLHYYHMNDNYTVSSSLKDKNGFGNSAESYMYFSDGTGGSAGFNFTYKYFIINVLCSDCSVTWSSEYELTRFFITTYPLNNTEISCFELNNISVNISFLEYDAEGTPYVNISMNGSYHNYSAGDGFVGNGTYYLNVSNLTCCTEYYWYVNVSDGFDHYNKSWYVFSCSPGCDCYQEIALLNSKLNQILEKMNDDDFPFLSGFDLSPEFLVFSIFFILLFIWFQSESLALTYALAMLLVPYSIVGIVIYALPLYITDANLLTFLQIMFLFLALIIAGYTLDLRAKDRKSKK